MKSEINKIDKETNQVKKDIEKTDLHRDAKNVLENIITNAYNNYDTTDDEDYYEAMANIKRACDNVLYDTQLMVDNKHMQTTTKDFNQFVLHTITSYSSNHISLFNDMSDKGLIALLGGLDCLNYDTKYCKQRHPENENNRDLFSHNQIKSRAWYYSFVLIRLHHVLTGYYNYLDDPDSSSDLLVIFYRNLMDTNLTMNNYLIHLGLMNRHSHTLTSFAKRLSNANQSTITHYLASHHFKYHSKLSFAHPIFCIIRVLNFIKSNPKYKDITGLLCLASLSHFKNMMKLSKTKIDGEIYDVHTYGLIYLIITLNLFTSFIYDINIQVNPLNTRLINQLIALSPRYKKFTDKHKKLIDDFNKAHSKG